MADNWRRQTGLFRAGDILSKMTGKNVIGGGEGAGGDHVRFDFDGSVSDFDTSTISEHTGYPTEARGWSLFVWRPGRQREE